MRGYALYSLCCPTKPNSGASAPAVISKTLTLLFAALFVAPLHAADASLDDASLVAFLKNANAAEIQAGKLASERAKSKDVKAFGKMMVAEHRLNDTEVAAVTKRLGIQAKDTETTIAMKSDAQKQNAQVGQQRGKSFDEAYIDEQIAMHRAVLQTLDTAISNGAGREAEFAAVLKKTRAAVAMHLQHAEGLKPAHGAPQR